MKTLIKQAKVLFPNSPYHNQTVSVLIENGITQRITDEDIPDADEIIESKNLRLSPGWFDLRADFAEPGYEHRETLKSGAAAASKGGFTGVQILPNTKPILDARAQVEYVQKNALGLSVQVLPFGAISEGLKGENICEMYDMHQAGVKAFTDGNSAIQNPDLLRRAMLYTSTFNGVLMLYASDHKIAHSGMMHEGEVSTSLGLTGSAALAETLMISRDLYLADYCETPLHFSCISSAESVHLIRSAKEQGLPVTCDVAVANLVYTDECLKGFDSNFKVLPHLRTEEDRMALIEGIQDGTIDAIVSNHSPWNIEEKDCEFDHASFGMASIEFVYPLIQNKIGDAINEETLIQTLSTNPREILGLEKLEFEVGTSANFTLFDSSLQTDFSSVESKSSNHPEVGNLLKGKIVGTIG